jgi:hypothetical protein
VIHLPAYTSHDRQEEEEEDGDLEEIEGEETTETVIDIGEAGFTLDSNQTIYYLCPDSSCRLR